MTKLEELSSFEAPKTISLDSVHWLQEKVAKAWEDYDPAQVIPLLQKMLSVARNNDDALIFAHLGLAEAYEALQEHSRMRRHRRLALQHAVREFRDGVREPGDKNPWVDDDDRLGDYRGSRAGARRAGVEAGDRPPCRAAPPRGRSGPNRLDKNAAEFRYRRGKAAL